MKKSRTKFIVMIVSLLLFVATIGLMISMSKIDRQTEDTTTFYTATVKSVDVSDKGENIFVEIRTNEYDASLYISRSISKSIKMDDIRNLKNGQMIFFGIENKNVRQMNKVEFVSITSLKTDTKDILSLEKYNKCINDSAYPARIASVVVALLFLFISILLFKNHRKNIKKRCERQGK